MHHLTCGISFFLHSANLILLTRSPPGSPRPACAYHLITIATFGIALIIYHYLDLSLQT